MEPREPPDSGLRISPRSTGFSPKRTAEADRFAQERIRQRLSTGPTDEPAVEDALRRVYAAAGLASPRHIHWLDGPLELVAALAAGYDWAYVEDDYRGRVPHCVWDDMELDHDELALMRDGSYNNISASIDFRIRELTIQAETRVRARMVTPDGKRATDGIEGGVWRRVGMPLWQAIRESIAERVWRTLADDARCWLAPRIRDGFWSIETYSTWHGICAFDDAPTLAEVRFYDEYFEPNQAGTLARFAEQVSGYWFGQYVALLVRRPRLLARDAEGRLHGEMARCVEYPDGWGFWAWHGVSVPERVVLAPDDLTRDDFLHASNIEVRRVIQERMGERFVPEIGGTFVDSCPRGVLYEIELRGDPDRVARYLQVQDPSTGREYYLRVPPTIGTAEAAAAWTFGMSVHEYGPIRES